MMSAARLLLGILACQGLLIRASPVGPKNAEGRVNIGSALQDLPILVPDTVKIDSDSLKTIGADKFLTLWVAYVVSGKVVLSDEPSTFLVPLNSGLPRDPSFLADKEYTKEILLNHVIVGDVIDKISSAAGNDLFYSLADAELIFSQEGSDFLVNGVRLTGDEFQFGNIKVYVVEETIPFLEPDFFDYISDAPAKKEPILQDLKEDVLNLVDNNELFARIPKEKKIEITTEAETTSTTKLVTTTAPPTTTEEPITTNKLLKTTIREFPKPTKREEKITTVEAISFTPTTTEAAKPAIDGSSRPTRFDKFRNRANNEVSKIQKKPIIEKEIPSVAATTSSATVTEAMVTTFTLHDGSLMDVEIATNEEFAQGTTDSSVNIFESFLPSSEKSENANIKMFNEFETSSGLKESEFLEESFIEDGEFAETGPNTKDEATFASSLMNELDTPNSRASEFVHHFNDVHLESFLEPDKNYTAIIPINGAFYNFYPIDWGFNPFLVENFTKEVLLNHIMEGDIHLQMFNDSVEIQTIAGRIIKVNKDTDGNLLVNGNMIPAELEVEFDHGRIYYIDQMLFVDYDRVNKLREEYPWLETAPLLGFPWPTSPFLSHLLQRLQENNETKVFAHLLKNSDIAHMVSSSDENMNRLTYTAFVPNDTALTKAIGVENLATFEPKAINDFLLQHIVSGYLFKEDFEEGFNLLSLSNSALPIKMSNNSIFLGPSKIIDPEQFVYNLGAIFMIDKPFKNIAQNPSKSVSNQLVSDVKIVPLPRENRIQSMSSLYKDALLVDPSVTEPAVQYEVRTEISFSRQINNGKVESIPKEFIRRLNSLS